MAYTAHEYDKPDPSSSDGMGTTLDWIRTNGLAIRDSVTGFVGMLGWDAELQDSDGTYPPTSSSEPDQIVHSRTFDTVVHQLKVALTYVSSGAAEGNVETAIFSYKVGGGSWEVMGDTDFPLAKATYTYDATSGDFLKVEWT